MAEGYESYHVPQQSRRDKLRVGGCVVESAPTTHHHHQLNINSNLHGLFHPIYDPSLIPSDFLTHGYAVKEEGISLMGYVSSSSSAATSRHHHYLDPQSSLPVLNPSSIQDMNSGANNPFLYNLRDFDQSSYNGANEVVVYKPEPLSLTHQDSNNTGTGTGTGHGGGGGGGGQGLSLSLSSHHNLPLELNLQRYDGGGYVVPAIVGGGGSASTSNDVSRTSVPLGPFTGYASILKGSRFLKPAQQLLEEFCDVGRGIYAEKFAADSSFMDHPPLESFSSGGVDDGAENRRKKSRLISMLDEVYRRYKQYYQQMQSVMASFEYVAGLGNAAPYANLALKTMSKHFKCLKNAITDQLQFTNKAHGQLSHGKDEAGRFENTDRGFYSQRPVNNSGYLENQSVWRPQRGLPERAVTVLRAWLFEHFLHPYPTDTDKIMLAKQTGLSRSQVSNWFINARVRLWKPMVEEIHMLETRQAHKGGLPREDRSANRPSDHLNSANAVTSENPNTSRRLQDTPSKRSRNDLADVLVRNEEPQNLSYNNLSSSHTQGSVGVGGSGSGSVSLTLGLHQNNGIGLSESFPINAAQRFGLAMEGNNEGYVMNGFEAQHRHFGRDVGGQLLHDFVG